MDNWTFDFTDFIKLAESHGFEVAEKNIEWDVSFGQGSGASFSCRVDVLKYIDTNYPDKFPRLREKFKERQFDINIIRTDSRYSHEYTMSTDIRDNIEEKEDDALGDALGEIAEGGGDLVDSISDLAEDILHRARGMAKELHRKMERSYLDELDDSTAADNHTNVEVNKQ